MSSGRRFIAQRTARALFTACLVVTLTFLLLRLVPGDPVDAVLGEQATAADRVQLRNALGLDQPWPAQYLRFWGDVLSGTLGHSFRSPSRSVASMIAEVLPDTLALAGCAMLVALGFALPLGVLSAARRGTWLDSLGTGFALLGLSMPTIWVGPLLVLVFAVTLRALPLPGDDVGGLLALVLPSFTVGFQLAASLTRQTRAAMIEVLGQPYIAAARARGLPEWAVVLRHGLRNALLPVLTVFAAQLSAMLSGAVIAEKIFERRGLGTLFLEAFFSRDLPVVQGVVLVVGIFYVSVSLVLDATYAWADPRVRGA
jgi:peptide/nickel transport system permease protein